MAPVPSVAAARGGDACIGRFGLVLPEGWMPTGREQRIFFTRVDDDLPQLAPGVSAADAARRVLRGDAPPSDPVLREFVLDGVGAAAWFGLGSRTSPNVRLVALAGRPDAGLRMEALATRGREAQVETGLRQLAAGYRTGVQAGFCLARGAIVLGPSRSESARLVATRSAPAPMRLSISTRTVEQPREDGPLADPAADAAAMAGSGTSIRAQPPRERTVAGLEGRDTRGELVEDGKPAQAVYRFFFPGRAGDAMAPELIVALDGPVVQRPLLDETWASVLDSMRLLPAR
ncbi:MAG: T6SS immunity protein Tli4 family protein [Rubrivivax sp.]|jgi:hypothetical protein|nr:T6SS immunity protein Tli4 family protein [Rubrivivax sp.]